MYVIRDALTPAINSHKSAAAFKNIVMRHFPKTIVNGVLTFDRLIIWNKDAGGVIKDNAHLRLYNIFGMKVKDYENQNYSGVAFTFIYLRSYTSPNGVVVQDDVRNYITEYAPVIYPLSKDPFNPDPLAITDLNPDPYKNTVNALWDANGWITVDLTYTPTTTDTIDNAIVDSQIIQKVKDVSLTEIFYNPHVTSRLTALAILDLKTNAVFETRLVVKAKSISVKNSTIETKHHGAVSSSVTTQTRYVSSAIVELKFRKIVDVKIPLALPLNVTTYLDSVVTRISGLATTPVIQDAFLRPTLLSVDASRSFAASINQQLVILANWKNPYVDDLLTLVVDPSSANSYYATGEETAIKVSGLADLPPKQFKKTFLSLMKFDYAAETKKGHWYDMVVTIVILIVAIVVSVYSWNWQIAALAFSIGAAAEGVWAMYLAKNGGGTGAIHQTMGISNALGIAAMVAGIAAIYQQWITKATTEAAKQAALQQVETAVASGSEAAIASASEQYIAASLADMATQSITSLISDSISSLVQVGTKTGAIDSDSGSLIGGLTSVASGSYDFLASSKTALNALPSLDDVVDTIKKGITKFTSRPMSDIMNQCVNWLNSGFNMYMKLISPPNEGLSDKKAELDAIEKEVEATNPDNVDIVWTAYTDPYGSIFEVGDYVDKTYIMLTSGMNRSLMNKCYDSGYRI